MHAHWMDQHITDANDVTSFRYFDVRRGLYFDLLPLKVY